MQGFLLSNEEWVQNKHDGRTQVLSTALDQAR